MSSIDVARDRAKGDSDAHEAAGTAESVGWAHNKTLAARTATDPEAAQEGATPRMAKADANAYVPR